MGWAVPVPSPRIDSVGGLGMGMGDFQSPPDWQEILTYFRGSELQNYFTRILEDNMKAIIKPQYVDHIPKAVKGNVGEVLTQKDERGQKEMLCADLELNQVRGQMADSPCHPFPLF